MFSKAKRDWETEPFNDQLTAIAIKEAMRENLISEANDILWYWLHQFDVPIGKESGYFYIAVQVLVAKKNKRCGLIFNLENKEMEFLSSESLGELPSRRWNTYHDLLSFIRSYAATKTTDMIRDLSEFLSTLLIDYSPLKFRLERDSSVITFYLKITPYSAAFSSDPRSIINASLIIRRVVLVDELEFRITDRRLYPSGREIENLSLSGPAYLIAGYENPEFYDFESEERGLPDYEIFNDVGIAKNLIIIHIRELCRIFNLELGFRNG